MLQVGVGTWEISSRSRGSHTLISVAVQLVKSKPKSKERSVVMEHDEWMRIRLDKAGGKRVGKRLSLEEIQLLDALGGAVEFRDYVVGREGLRNLAVRRLNSYRDGDTLWVWAEDDLLYYHHRGYGIFLLEEDEGDEEIGKGADS